MKSDAGFGGDSGPPRTQSIAAHALIYVLTVAVTIRIAPWFGLLFWVNYVLP